MEEDDRLLRAIVEAVEAETGEEFFRSLVQNLAAGLGVQYAFVTEFAESRTRFRSIALWGRGAFRENFDVPLAGTPCESVLAGAATHHPAGLQGLFPDDTALGAWGVESYCGVPILDRAGEVLGHFAVLDDRPMPDAGRALSVMRIFAARARAEIERARAAAALAESEARLARLVESATDAILSFDETGAVQIFNRAAERVLRCAAADALGTPLARFMTEPGRGALDASLARLAADAATLAFVGEGEGLLARRADGTLFPFEASLSRSESGGRPLFTIILRDVEERRQAAREQARLQRQSEYLQEEIRSYHNVDEIVGQSPALLRLLEGVARVAGTDATVLVRGETGTGKELVARAIHARSRRADRPLVKVNCAALPTGLVESELFGHEKGSFTGAVEVRTGRFELADGGTIFLDEIGDLPLEAQAKLLRVLQEHEFERLGSSRTRRVDVRVIAATNRDLARAVGEGAFRQDLYYRLNVFPVTLPPLRERTGDVALLVHYFVSRYATKIGRRITTVPERTMERLLAYEWPGNVRELENVIERAVVLSPGPDLEVAAEALPVAVTDTARPSLGPAPAGPTLEDAERHHIVAVLERTRWRIDGPQGAARILNLRPSTLRSRMQKLGIRRGAEPEASGLSDASPPPGRGARRG